MASVARFSSFNQFNDVLLGHLAEECFQSRLERLEQELRWMDPYRTTTIMRTDDLILEIQSLPVEERARVADCILRSLNQTVSEVDQKWADLAARRLQDIQTSAIKPVAGDDVFAEIWRRFD